MGKLTALGVKAATEPGSYQDGDGLMLLVKPPSEAAKQRGETFGARSWQLRLQVDGKRRDFGLGPASSVGLADARTKADEVRKLFRSGVDPVAKKRADKMAQATIPTFRKAAESTHADMKAGWRNAKHRKDWLSSLERYAFDSIGDTRVDMVTAPMVRDMLLPIWLEKAESARRVRQRVKAVMDWATAKGFRPVFDMTAINKGLPRQPRNERHFEAMDYADVPAFIAKVTAGAETIGRMALLFTIYTGARSGETRGATWAEIDLEAKEWRVPAIRMKGGKEHVVPLSDPALAILERLKPMAGKNKDAPIFVGNRGKPLSDMTLTKVMRDMNLSATVHGFRSAFKDWAVESTGFPDAVSEAALAHKDADKVRSAYRRTDFRKMRVELMAAWAAHCLSGVKPSTTVTPIRRAG